MNTQKDIGAKTSKSWFLGSRYYTLLLASLMTIASAGHYIHNNLFRKDIQNVVTDFQPVKKIPNAAAAQLDSLVTTGNTAHLNKAISSLDQNIFDYLGLDKDTVQSIEYFIIKENKKVSAYDAKGKLNSGIANNEVGVVVTTKNGERSKYFLRCANGMASEMDEETAKKIGESNSSNGLTPVIIEIKEGDSLWKLFGNDAHEVAFKNGIPLKTKNGIPLTKQTAEDAIKQGGISIGNIKPGDKFNMSDSTYSKRK